MMFEFIPVAHASDLSTIYAFGPIKSLGQGINYLTGPAFMIAGLGILFYLLYAAFKMITAGTDKNALEQARGMITHAIVGFLLLMMMLRNATHSLQANPAYPLPHNYPGIPLCGR